MQNPLSSWRLSRTSKGVLDGHRSDGGGRSAVVAPLKVPSSTKNNQLRTGADKGNPTV